MTPRLQGERGEAATAAQHAAPPAPSQERKVAFLQLPSSYPEGTGRVESIETHAAWVFLTDRNAYKLKKPVRFEWLDYRTLASRRRGCAEELRLNRRLAPDVYLRVVPLCSDFRGGLALDIDGEPIDWLVKMRRLPRERMLDVALRAGQVDERDVRRVGRRLARFYHALPAEPLQPAAYRGRLERELEDDLAQLAGPAHAARIDTTRIGARVRDLLHGHGELLEQRARAGYVVEGHGDLRPEHVCLEGRSPVIIDSVEFCREHRVVDPVDELAFLALECERTGAPWVARPLLATYRRMTRDDAPEELVRLHQARRAVLRAKLAIWRTSDPGARGLAHWQERARDYLRLADGACDAR